MPNKSKPIRISNDSALILEQVKDCSDKNQMQLMDEAIELLFWKYVSKGYQDMREKNA